MATETNCFEAWWREQGHSDTMVAKAFARSAYYAGHALASADSDGGKDDVGDVYAEVEAVKHAPTSRADEAKAPCVDRFDHPELRSCPECGKLFSTPGYFAGYTDDGWAVFGVLHPPRRIANAASKDDATDIAKELNRLLDK